MARDVQITFDCADPAALAEFWADALGYRVQSPPPGFETWEQALEAMNVPPEHRNDASAVVDPDGSGPRLFFQKVPEGKQVKNRVHLDVRAAPGLTGADRMAALETEAERLVARGATRVRRYEPAPPLGQGHIVLTGIPRATSSAWTDRPPDYQGSKYRPGSLRWLSEAARAEPNRSPLRYTSSSMGSRSSRRPSGSSVAT